MTVINNIPKEQLLAGIILDHITKHPEQHDQLSWVDGDFGPSAKPGCGTTACVSGYTVLFTNDPRFYLHKVSSLTNEWTVEEKGDFGFKEAGREHLGLSDYDASVLFFRTNNEQARKALEFLANGESIDWTTIFEKENIPHPDYTEYDTSDDVW